ncbi:S8 family serine peptidase [uncultured Corynebacterium sp.]|uniref:S8 family peptidase n=1 Tax=uncultured Corynebacterium sp. TaxID=159447 RepID=UPI0025DBFA89|nr:S8 family serine peptidase [uncultured Corynebacterium sp.]
MSRWPAVVCTAAVCTTALLLSGVPVASAQDSPEQCGVPEPGEPLPVDAALPHDVATGTGVGIALVDTGASTPWVVPGRAGDGSTDSDHCVLHGTAVAGVLHTVAPGATVVSHRQVTDRGSGTVAGLVDALERAVAHAGDHPGVRIVNLSLVACQDTVELRRAVADAEDAGLLLVAAAGNSGQCAEGRTPFPASLPGVLTVGAVDARIAHVTLLDHLGPGRVRAGYSVPGPWVDLAAPGGPVSTVLRTGTGEVTVVGDPEPFAGTSFAAPVVSATAALVWQVRPELSAAQVRDVLVSTARSGGVPVVDPAAAVAAVMGGEPGGGDVAGVGADAGAGPWAESVDLVAAPEESVDLLVPLALATLVLVGVLGAVVRRRPRS